jgi:hypothetical protein
MSSRHEGLRVMTALPEGLNVDGASCRLFGDAPSWNGLKTAAIGGFRCESVAAGEALLREAAALLGPMDGDTWHTYRVVVESDGSAPFAMEPVSGPHDRAAFESNGFAPVSSYVSTRATLADAIGQNAPVTVTGVTVTPWDGQNAGRLIGGLFDMSATSFAEKAFFKPIAREEFLKLYEPMLPAIDPRFVLFARDQNGLIGFLFGLPNLAEGKQPKTVILKTYASARPGVGHLLADTFHRTARDLGFTDVIHALMHVDNASLARSKQHEAKIFRRYALMARRLS